VLPKLGIAYLDDDRTGSWAITRGTPGSGLEALRKGQRVQLALMRFPHFTVVKSYAPLA
jgi:hypothetical protein